MRPLDRHVSAARLLLENVRSLLRGVAPWGGAAAFLVLVALAGALGTGGPEGAPLFLFFLWCVAPLLIGVILATRIARARRTRAIDCLFTTPLTQSTWIASEALVGLVLALALMAAALPFVGVYAAHLGVPAGFADLLLAATAMGAFSVALGLFCGVIVGDAGPGVAAGLAGGIAGVSFLSVIVEGILLAGEGAVQHPALLRALHGTPLALAIDIAQLDLGGAAPSSPWPAFAALMLTALALFVAAWLAYTRYQSVLDWEGAPSGRWLVGAIVVAALVAPPAIAAPEYHPSEHRSGDRFDEGRFTRIALARSGAPITDHALTILATVWMDPLPVGARTPIDLLVMPRVPANATISALDVRVEATPDLAVEGGVHAVDPAPDGTAHETLGPGSPGDPVGEVMPVFRVPLAIEPRTANAISYGHSTMWVNVTFTADGVTRASASVLTVVVEVAGAKTELLAAGAPLPLLFAGGAVVRRARTG